MSNVYVLFDSAFGPIDRSTVFPLAPSVETTTPLFSLTSRSLRPRHRTTTRMLVSSLISRSKSLSFLLLTTLDGSLGDLSARALLDGLVKEAEEDDLSVAVEVVRLVGGRIALRLVGRPEAGRGGPAMVTM